ncbi:type II toxin-antitoxin system VapC family toxin [Agrococcus sp. Ld7]|uniref:type II toxin-antitoxin system VapC family toxin n=1 Tax=Agrococcus sp. Ld7 TaxID=649148 RepID=UPI00386877BD
MIVVDAGIVIDAGILIALWNRDDAHHELARGVFEARDSALMHPVNLGEALVYAVAQQQETRARAQLELLGIRAAKPAPDEAFLLARARVATRLRMPDCCALVTAEHLGLPLATTDRRLADAARSRGVVALC